MSESFRIFTRKFNLNYYKHIRFDLATILIGNDMLITLNSFVCRSKYKQSQKLILSKFGCYF